MLDQSSNMGRCGQPFEPAAQQSPASAGPVNGGMVGLEPLLTARMAPPDKVLDYK